MNIGPDNSYKRKPSEPLELPRKRRSRRFLESAPMEIDNRAISTHTVTTDNSLEPAKPTAVDGSSDTIPVNNNGVKEEHVAENTAGDSPVEISHGETLEVVATSESQSESSLAVPGDETFTTSVTSATGESNLAATVGETVTTNELTVESSLAAGEIPVGESSLAAGEIPVVESSLAAGEIPVGESSLAAGEIPVGESSLVAGEIPVGESSLAAGEIPVGESSLAAGEIPVGESSLVAGEIPVGESSLAAGEIPVVESSLAAGEIPVGESSLAAGEIPVDESSLAAGEIPVGDIYYATPDKASEILNHDKYATYPVYQISVNGVSHTVQYIPKKQDASPNYIFSKDKIIVYPFDLSSQQPLYPRKENGDEGYLELNGVEHYARDKQGNPIYAKDALGNEIPPKMKGQEYYASNLFRKEIYPKLANGDEYYIFKVWLEIPAYDVRRAYYAKDHNHKAIYPKKWENLKPE